MKPQILFSFAIILLSFSSFAQGFTGGIKAGVVGSQVDGDGYRGFNKPGIFGGAYVNLRTSELSAFQMEIAFVQKGSRKNPNYEKDDFEQYLLRTDYVELAFLYHLVYSDKLTFEAGPSFGYLMSTYEERNQMETVAVPFRKSVINYIAGMYYYLNDRTAVNLRINNAVLSLRDYERLPGDTYRFFHYGQFNIAMVLGLQYRL
ncbi:MAG: outer membrane beta-barrel protein [Bacteroidales bacterium]|nr:outer membrane beta-barrel protein [Bacteroidales bacterium]